MKRSTDRILTTHTGSLPRPMGLSVMLEEFDLGEMPDRTKFENRVRDAWPRWSRFKWMLVWTS